MSVDPPDVDAGVGDVDGAPSDIDASVGPRFTDSFGDGALDGWLPWTHTGCTVMETGGMLQLDFSGSGESYCGVDTQDFFDLRTGSVTVKVVQAPSIANFETMLILFSADNTQQIHMIRDENGLVMQLRISGNIVGSTLITDPGEPYWRILQDGTTTVWETSSNATTWSVRHSTSIPVNASAMSVELAAGHYVPGTGSTVRVRFDDLIVE